MVSLLIESKNLSFEEISIDQRVSFDLQITKEMIEKFAELSGDYNPLHMDENYAKNSQFKQRISHGMLLTSFFSQLVGMHIPGKKCLYLSQNLNFHNPCFIGDKISIFSKVIDKSESTKIVKIESKISNEENKLLLYGIGRIIVRDD